MTEEEIRERVEEEIELRSRDWQELQRRVRELLGQYERDAQLSPAIYRIYTREERQALLGTDRAHLKSEAKIVQEIILRRKGGERWRSGVMEKVKKQKNFDIFDITDLIGVTVVCPFSSDVDLISQRILDDAQAGRGFKVDNSKRLERSDYEATHILVSIDANNISDLICEIQVKTAVQDAFGWKTHSLAYKPEPGADMWFIGQFQRIGKVLRVADDLGDELKKKLTSERAFGETKRLSALEHLTTILEHRAQEITDDKRLLAFVENALSSIATAKTAEPAEREAILNGLQAKIDAEFTEDPSADAFRVAARWAVAFGRNDKVYWLLRKYKTWVATLDADFTKLTPEEQYKFLLVSMLCMMPPYILKDTRLAISIGERARTRIGDLKGHMVARLNANLAYFWAVLARTDQIAAGKARWYCQEATRVHSPLPEPVRDTLGYVKIETGKTLAEVEEGLKECRLAYDDVQARQDIGDKEKKVSSTYFDLHRELAYAKLAALSGEAT